MPPVYNNINPCVPSPCGPNSQCRTQDNRAVCSCLPNYIGRAPNCRPECTVNSDCSSNLACINEKCKDPCVGSCGFNSECKVASHTPLCVCTEGYTGNPFVGCQKKVPSKMKSLTPNPTNLNLTHTTDTLLNEICLYLFL